MRLAIVLAGLAAVAGSCMAAAPKLTVQITNANDYCFILPSTRMTIGDSEDGGDGAKSFCTKPKSGQGQLPTGADAWKHGPNYLKKKTYVQITGCINTRKYKTLIPSDGGGQYDSDGGAGGLGNPRNSVCTGYKSYVEVVEPDSGRICIRCCNDNKYCPLQYDTQGCAAVVRNGDYSGC